MTNENQIQIKATDEALVGKYANLLSVSHTPEEFVLDFISFVPAARTASLTSRIMTSPGHVKRIVKALNDQIEKYEKNFGTIKTAEDPGTSSIGF